MLGFGQMLMGAAGPLAYGAGGTDGKTTPGTYSFVVPAGKTLLKCKLWGAAGGNGIESTAKSLGGRGGYTYVEIPVTPGETLTFIIGEGGTSSGGPTIGGGGYNPYGNGGSPGGGRTAIRRGTTELATAGGGGGAGFGQSGAAAHGGHGGGTTGSGGTATSLSATPGGGGTQSAGGSAGGSSAQAGSQYQGGNSDTLGYRSGAGGGGFYGGGGAQGLGAETAGGGGGSGFVHPTLTQNGVTLQSSSAGVANDNDPDYAGGAGLSVWGQSKGGDGRLVVGW